MPLPLGEAGRGGSEACAEAPPYPRGSGGLIHPGDGCTDPADGRKLARGRRWLPPCLGRLGLGQPARRLHLGCGCGVRLRREAAPDIPWSPSRQGEGTSPHPGIKSKQPLGLAYTGLPTLLLSVCPAQPGQTKSISPMCQLPSPCTGRSQPRTLPSLLAPPPPAVLQEHPHPPGWTWVSPHWKMAPQGTEYVPVDG